MAGFGTITDVIAVEQPRSAVDFVEAVRMTCALIGDSPLLGAVFEFQRVEVPLSIRRMPVRGFRKYLVFYTVRPDVVVVLRVLHGARDLPELFGE